MGQRVVSSSFAGTEGLGAPGMCQGMQEPRTSPSAELPWEGAVNSVLLVKESSAQVLIRLGLGPASN